MDKRSQLKDLLEEALQALANGDAADAERRAKAVSAIARADRDVAELIAADRGAATEQDDEALRLELRRRLARFSAERGAPMPREVLERLELSDGSE